MASEFSDRLLLTATASVSYSSFEYSDNLVLFVIVYSVFNIWQDAHLEVAM